MVEPAPAAVDLQDFQFKLHSKLKIFDFTDDSQFKASTNLIVAASKYGLIFVGSPSASIEVVQSKTIESTNTGKVESTNYAKRSIPLPSAPSHLALNCDQSLVAVVVAKDGCATAIIYSVPSFLSHNVAIVREIRVSVTSGVSALETCWNPAMPTVYTACKSDGSLGVYNIQENSVDINEIPAMARATSFCWSPKGKQIVVGSMNGTLTQYKPDLKAVKAIPAPSLQGAGPFSVVNVFWLTNYQFVAVYNDVSNPDARPVILIVNAPKAGAVTYINYEDICYSYGNLRSPQFYIIHQPAWGVLLVASANSMEVGVLGVIQSGEPAMWQQWNQIDAARAELPLSANHQETFPVGFAFDTGIIMQLPWGENQSLPPMPMIHVLSHHGVLCSFSVINVRQGVAPLCIPPEPVPDQSGLSQFRVQQQAMPPPAPVTSVIATPNNPVTQVGTAPHAVSFGLSAGDSLAPTISSTFAKPTAQPATLFGGSPAPPLFGTTPNFSAPAVQSPSATASPSTPTMKLSANSASMFSSLGGAAKPPTPSIGTPTFGAVSASSTGALNFSMPSTASVANTSSSSATPTFGGSTLFGGLASIGTSVADGSSNKTSLTALSATTAPNFQSMNLSTKPIAQNVVTSLNTSTPAALTMAPAAVKSQVVGTPAFSVKPMVQPLLATPKDVQPINVVPKQATKPDILSNSQTSCLNQTPIQTPLPTSDFPSIKKDDTVLNNHAIQCQIRDELKNFHVELQELFHRCRNIDLNVGTDEEKTNIVLATDALMEFYKELQETTDSLMTDVHYLKQAVMQSFAWYEDTKSRQKRYTDPNFANLLQAQELDPFSEKQLTYIKHLIYDIESQLKQVDSFLDNQWADFQDSCKKQARDKMQIPMLEPIYQSLVRQNAILDKQRYILKDISSRIKTRNRKAASYPSVMNFNLGNNKNDIQIDEELSKLKIDSKDIFAYKYEKIVSNERKFTQNKQTKLCEFFTNRSVVHIAPKKPKWLSSPLFRTPSKVVSVPSYITSPNVQRSLNQTFENIAQNKFDLPQVTTVETNISSSNLFSFTLLDSSQTKWQSLEKNSSIQQKTIASSSMLNMPKTSEIQAFKPVVTMTSSVSENIPSTYNMKNSAPTSISVASAPVFSFTAASSNVTQTKPQYFTSNTNTQSSVPVSFSLGSNITITPVSSHVEKDKTNQVKPNTIFSFSLTNSTATAAIPQNKADSTTTKVVESKKESTKPALTAPEVILIKPNVIKTSSSTESTFFGGLPTPEVKTSQPFTFTVPQPKSGSTPKEPIATASTGNTFKIASDNFVPGRDSLDTTSAAFSFGKALSMGQQSTPKVKSSSSLVGTVVVPPISAAPVILDAATSSVSNTQKVAPKPAFSIAQPTVPVSSKSTGSPATTSQTSAPETATVVSTTPVMSNVETISTTTSLFGNVSMASPTASTASVFKQPLSTPSTATANPTAFTTGTSSLFSAVSVSTPAVVTSSIFGQQVATTATTSTPIPSSTASIFAQAISTLSTNPVASNASIFSNTQTSTPGLLFGSKSTTPQTTTSLFEQKPESNSTTSTPSTGFSFVQSVANVPAVELPKQTSIFGGAAQTTSSSPGFGSTATTTSTSGFSFLQPANTTSTTTQQTTAKTTIFSSAGETKPAETVSAQPDTAKSSQESTFGFDSLAVSSAENNKFSFGNLTVSALSPNANTTTTISTAGTSTFSFALPAATPATTTTTTSFGDYGLFCKPAATTTASSFMGQPICSPSTFSQNTAPTFGQSGGNIFAQKPATPGATGGSIFGQNTGGSLFGGTGASANASSTASIFGQTASTPFGSSTPPATSKTGSIFGQSSDFGSNTAPTTTSGSIFGQNTFGNPAATSASSSFSFTQNAGANTSFGASSGSIFGTKPTFGQAPAFGQTASFSSPSAFGSAPAFGNPAAAAAATQNTGTFGSGFGSPSAFGQKAVFGSPPSFGQNTFGAPPAFGSSPSFSSPQRLFGPGTASPPGGTFGAAVQENSTFANLANQSTLGFGSLAQNQSAAAPPQAPQFSGGSQFSSWR